MNSNNLYTDRWNKVMVQKKKIIISSAHNQRLHCSEATFIRRLTQWMTACIYCIYIHRKAVSCWQCRSWFFKEVMFLLHQWTIGHCLLLQFRLTAVRETWQKISVRHLKITFPDLTVETRPATKKLVLATTGSQQQNLDTFIPLESNSHSVSCYESHLQTKLSQF